MGDGADVYKGNYKFDLRDGYGTFKWGLTGAYFRGQFKDDTMNGQGLYTWNNGSTFDGEF